jgi:hypothetical protein
MRLTSNSLLLTHLLLFTIKNKYLLFAIFLIYSQSLTAQTLGSEYRLKKIIAVDGRQGIAADENYYYISCSKDLYKYDKNGNFVQKNNNPFAGLEKEANHIGDIDVWNNEIYAGIEIFEFGISKNIQIAVYDAATIIY